VKIRSQHYARRHARDSLFELTHLALLMRSSIFLVIFLSALFGAAEASSIDSTTTVVNQGSFYSFLYSSSGVYGYHYYTNAAGRDSYRVQAIYENSAGTTVTSTLCTVTVTRGYFSSLGDSYSCTGSDCVSSNDDECSGIWKYPSGTSAMLRIRCDASDNCAFSKVRINKWDGGTCPDKDRCETFCTDQGYSSDYHVNSICKCATADLSSNAFVTPICTKPPSSPPPPPVPSPPPATSPPPTTASTTSPPPPPASTTSPTPTTESPPPPAASAVLTSEAHSSLTLYLSWVAASIMLMFAC
jgi:hypothetical protein